MKMNYSLNCLMMWKAWLFGIFWHEEDLRFEIPAYAAIHLGPLVIMIERKNEAVTRHG